ncbi:MAG: P-loop NTPase [Pirellulales bacterium]
MRRAVEPPRPFRATFEVEKFAWLPLIDNLCVRQQAGFDQVLLELETELVAGRNVVAVTSVKRGEGRTVMTQCLAKRAVNAGLSVCIVDFDDANPRLAEALGLAVETGWEQLLDGKSLCDAVIESVGDGMSAVLLKHPLAAETLIERAAECAAWMDRLRREFDLVLLDTTPAIDAEMGATGNLPIDGWLVVRDVHQTSLPELARWQRRVAGPNVNLLGVLENRADEMPPLAKSG